MVKNELSVVIVTFKSEDKIYKCLDSHLIISRFLLLRIPTIQLRVAL